MTGLVDVRMDVIRLPWTSIGYTQWPNLPVIQIALIFGVHGVSFILLLFNSLMAVLIISK